MAERNPRRIEPHILVQLLNSHIQFGTVISIAKLRKHRQSAGSRISSDGQTVDVLKYIAWLILERHARAPDAPLESQATGVLTRLLEERRLSLQKVRLDRAKSRT